VKVSSDKSDRRQFIERSLKVSGAGLLAGMSLEAQALLAWADNEAVPRTGERSGQTMPMGKIGSPKDIVAPIEFFASDEAWYVTGQILMVDGGSFVNANREITWRE